MLPSVSHVACIKVPPPSLVVYCSHSHVDWLWQRAEFHTKWNVLARFILGGTGKRNSCSKKKLAPVTFGAWAFRLPLVSASWYGVQTPSPRWVWMVPCPGSNGVRAPSVGLETTWLQQHISAWVWSFLLPSTSSSSSLTGCFWTPTLYWSSCLSLPSGWMGNEVFRGTFSRVVQENIHITLPCFLWHPCLSPLFIPLDLLW